MPKVILATSNKHKFFEIKNILLPEELGIELIFGGELVDSAPPETGSTFFENALIKARFYGQKTNMPSLADDSGLVVPALGGKPGIMSARFAGEGCTYEDNNRKLLKMMESLPDEMRGAKFVCVAVLWLPYGEVFSTKGELHGKITREPRGTGGFGYDPVFELPDGRTVAELSSQEKNAISHRAKAFEKMRKLIIEIIKSGKID